MRTQMIIDKYGEMDAEARVGFLVNLASYLTIVARDAYPEATPDMTWVERVVFLREINELQHYVLNQLRAFTTDSHHRYPDDLFCEGLNREGTVPDRVQDLIDWAISKAFEETGIT